jgi:hypothetical protein
LPDTRAPKIASQDQQGFAAGGRWLASRCCNVHSSHGVVPRVHQVGSRLRDMLLKPTSQLFLALLQVVPGRFIVLTTLGACLEGRIRDALAAPGRPGLHKIAKQFGVGTGTVQRIAHAN